MDMHENLIKSGFHLTGMKSIRGVKHLIQATRHPQWWIRNVSEGLLLALQWKRVDPRC